MECVGRPSANHSGGATFIHGKTMNVVSRSRYGKKALSNLTRGIGEARNLKAPPSKLRMDAPFNIDTICVGS